MPYLTVNNQHLFYRHNDREADLPALVLIHGAGGRGGDWPFQWQQSGFVQSRGQPRWVTDFPLFFLDLPGHGNSEGPGRDSVLGYAEMVVAFVRELGLRRVVLAGHSLGGAIALQAALLDASRLAGLVLIGTGAQMPVSEMILTGLQTQFAETVAMINKFAWRKNSAPVQRDVAVQHMVATGSDTLYGDFYACSQFDLRAEIGQIELPALVVVGAEDRMMPAAHSQFLVDHMPAAELLVIPEAGHFVMIEKAAKLSRELVAFLNRLRDEA
ncbi:MAG: alpha/beta hydrolase [Anaerolineales bacterium]|nr:alpha/beta hydrolase [Anaerolineales bacterium]